MARKAPSTRFPNAIAVSYGRALKKQVRDLHRETLNVFDEQIKEDIKALKRSDALEERVDGPLSSIISAVGIIKNVANAIYDVHISTNIAMKHIKLLDKMNLKNMEDQGRIKGVSPIDNNDKMADFLEAAVQENVSYITDIKDSYMTNIERVILQGAKKSSTIKGIRDELVKQAGMTIRRAEFIAKDQTGTIFGQLTAERHKNMGVEKFTWRTAGDERVRDSHESLNGEEFPYDDPPAVGLPGEDFSCRCQAEPVFD
ncbi:hypothetical protein MJ3_13599 [Salimicrobium jeotgali]